MLYEKNCIFWLDRFFLRAKFEFESIVYFILKSIIFCKKNWVFKQNKNILAVDVKKTKTLIFLYQNSFWKIWIIGTQSQPTQSYTILIIRSTKSAVFFVCL